MQTNGLAVGHIHRYPLLGQVSSGSALKTQIMDSVGILFKLNSFIEGSMAMSMFISGSLLLAMGGIFHLLENRNPLEEIDRKKHLKFDLTVVMVSSLMVAGITILLLDGIVRTWLTNNVELFESIISIV